MLCNVYPFLVHLILFVTLSSLFLFLLGSLNIQLADTHDLSDYQLKLMGRYFSLILAGGFVTIPLVGAAMDKLGFPCTCVAIVIFGVIWSGLNLLGDINMVFYSFFFYTLFRSFLYPFVFAYMADVLGYEYFGMIGGIMYMVAAIASLAQIPLTSWAAGSCHIEYNIDCSSGVW